MSVRLLPLLQQGQVALLTGSPPRPQLAAAGAVGRGFTGQQVEEGQAAAQGQHGEGQPGPQGQEPALKHAAESAKG